MSASIRRPARRLAAALLALAAAGAAHASVSVHVIQNDPTAGDASIVPDASLPSADFLSPDINFQINDSSSTSLATFLNNPVFTNVRNGFDASHAANNTFLEINASAYLQAGTNSFVVGHDDGVVLAFADPAIGTVVNAPGPTSFSNSPFTVTVASAGYYAFDLKYVECCAGPADLVFQINGVPVVAPPVPEPAVPAMMAAGIAVLGLRRRRLAARAESQA